MAKHLYGLIAVLTLGSAVFINAVNMPNRVLEPVLYNSFDQKVTAPLLKGIEKYKDAFSETKLVDNQFYVVLSECNKEKVFIVNYLSCQDCAMRKLVEASNRFLKLNEQLTLPVVLESDLSHSNFFQSADGIRINPPREGYAITFNSENEVISAAFADF